MSAKTLSSFSSLPELLDWRWITDTLQNKSIKNTSTCTYLSINNGSNLKHGWKSSTKVHSFLPRSRGLSFLSYQCYRCPGVWPGQRYITKHVHKIYIFGPYGGSCCLKTRINLQCPTVKPWFWETDNEKTGVTSDGVSRIVALNDAETTHTRAQIAHI